MRSQDYARETIKDQQSKTGATPDGAFGRETLARLASLAIQMPQGLSHREFCAWWDALPGEPDEASAPPPSETHTGDGPRPAHLAAKGSRDRDGARAFRLGEDPGGDRLPRLLGLPRWLDVERSARYQRKPSATYCNIYAHDFAYLCGLYLPRVWWRDPDTVTEETEVIYGETVRELSADGLHDWLLNWSRHYGWQRYPGSNLDDAPRWLQGILDADPGLSIGLICGRVPGKGSGHITVALPQLPEYGRGAMVDSRGRVLSPLQSQAGSTNKQLFSKAWWTSRRFDSVIFAHAEVQR